MQSDLQKDSAASIARALGKRRRPADEDTPPTRSAPGASDRTGGDAAASGAASSSNATLLHSLQPNASATAAFLTDVRAPDEDEAMEEEEEDEGEDGDDDDDDDDIWEDEVPAGGSSSLEQAGADVEITFDQPLPPPDATPDVPPEPP
eukprot:1090917-Prymnesium_polylepis.1